MTTLDPAVLALATALGVGLLIGVERERRKGTGPGRGPGGLRTFALVTLLGALAGLAGGAWLAAAGLLLVGGYAIAAYLRAPTGDPGLTTEVALAIAYVLGVVATVRPALAAGAGVLVAALLAARTPLHRWVRTHLTAVELRDALLLAGSALVVLPLLPDRAPDPWGILNPQRLGWLVVVVLAINAAGYVALRALGPRHGLALAGLAAGFVSSTATHAAMGGRARAEPTLLGAAAAGAALSSVATVVQLHAVLALANPAVLRACAPALLAAGVTAVAWGLVNLRRAAAAVDASPPPPGRAFQPKTALAFALLVAGVLLAAALLTERFGAAGGVAGVVVAGLADTHAAAVAAATLVASGALPLAVGTGAVLGAFTVNAVVKFVVAYVAGGAAFGNRLLPGLLGMVAAAWLAAGLG